jgi:hypothetical protein
MSKQTGKIVGTPEAWDEGRLGTDPAHVRVAPPEVSRAVDDALGMQAISIRLDKDLIETFKTIAKIHGMGYQPLMREVLKRFADAEVKVLLAQMANAEHKQKLENGKQKVEIELSLEFEQKRAA